MSTRAMVVGRQAGLFPEGLPESDSGAEYVMAESMACLLYTSDAADERG